MEERFRIDGPRFEIARGTKDYPDVFEAVPEPPERLYVIGDPSALKEGLAVVGARKATPYGLNATKMLAGRAAELGVVVISGGGARLRCSRRTRRRLRLVGKPSRF